MYGIPEDFDWSFMIGQEVLQICIGRNEVIINFDNISITVECSFAHSAESKDADFDGILPLKATSLVSLIGYCPTRVIRQSQQLLEIHFSNREKLSLNDDSLQYESFIVNGADGPLIIV